MLVLEGAGSKVDFRQGIKPTVGSRSSDLATVLRQYIEKSGRRRPQWHLLAWLAPIALAFLWTALGAWVVLSEQPPAPVIAFLAVGLVIAWAGAVFLAPRIRKHYMWKSTGHKFREASRSAVRERLTNARAAFFTSLYTVPAGAVIGWALRNWLGG